ncbi:MAG: ATP-dependent 6-phosphofructokinase [Thermoanaerobaculia bacterium]|nr:ATP-dependent 6-phosphofructokinase [Thermoanaerobaculia bacterium]
MSERQRFGILTGGGDAPGLNAVIRAFVRSVSSLGRADVVGVLDGFSGLLEGRFRRLEGADVRGIHAQGGTILGTTNRVNPFSVPGPRGPEDHSAKVLANAHAHELDALVVIGGDGTLKIARELGVLGLPVVGVPKTIDNDLASTDYTFGFWTAIGVATDALDRLRDTAESHHRVMILEVMGRNAGWIALYAGLAGAADVILIPEIPYRPAAVADKIEERRNRRQAFSLVVVAEGAVGADGGGESIIGHDPLGHPRFGGAGERLARELGDLVPHEIRVTVLGHVQRGGSPVPFDRLLGARFGERAAQLALEGRFGRMVRLVGDVVDDVPIEDGVATLKRVDPQGELVRVARSTGIGFGADW